MKKPIFSHNQQVKKRFALGKISLTLCLLAVSLVCFTLSCRMGQKNPFEVMRAGVQNVVAPLRSISYEASKLIDGGTQTLQNAFARVQKLDELEQENARLRAENIQLQQKQSDTEQLQKLLKMKQQSQFMGQGARIIGKSSDAWSQEVTIDKGLNAGFHVGMPVVTPLGVVGQISVCGPTTAQVKLISDPTSSIAAFDQQTQAQGQVVGSYNTTLEFSYVTLDQNVNVGDTIVTNGLDGVYPQGFVLGKVISVQKPQDELYCKITLAQTLDIYTQRDVFVITSLADNTQ